MKTSIKDVGFAVFFLIVIAVVAVQAAEDLRGDGEEAASVEPAQIRGPGH